MEKEPKEPEMTIEEKNTKKIKAVEATRIDGKKFFQKGDYRTALQIYNRGALICNGIYDLSDELWTVVQEHEVVLDVNIATCHLKLKEYQEAIERCKMVFDSSFSLSLLLLSPNHRIAFHHLSSFSP